MSPTAEWLAKLRQQLADYRVPDGGVDNVPDSCVVILRKTVERLLDTAEGRLVQSAGQGEAPNGP